ncbi:bifunctional hydroxymethylpyrimidine kinase/phosphomethylpyrimidine kinase [Psychrobacillus vulpis]|uniref:Hydroxymethylpyrimidine/phosphomethylpyrimidine kinase n=1 Tax=Psychrobacillus vulpis TaxID=2325572 RepID=A0A544TTU8_9BACI|nr:bifunctional hydroxymethylpyrimidine kinase/phosphomethylpyrimidine kinase [Psychrobacillus vulpis]TQR20848.1 bifunctional hydroxymethylpyrimidine kinase/phosphomethylpyrimidine kinase [Psychrobacillus vulpis]
MVQVVMTVAGSDSGGGAGIQADLKTFQELGVFGTTAVTAITVQNTKGVREVCPMTPAVVADQMDAILEDFDVACIKTGMLFSADIIRAVAQKLHEFNRPLLVIDPVMIAKGGQSLLLEEAITALKTELLPLATIVTPNIPEAEVLAEMKIETQEDVEVAAKKLLQLGVKAVVMKGGHRKNNENAEDIVYMENGEQFTVSAKWVETKDTHGTGCTFSAALTAELAKGVPLQKAIGTAKQFIQAAISHGLSIGHGHGPTNHFAYRTFNEVKMKEDVINES